MKIDITRCHHCTDGQRRRERQDFVKYNRSEETKAGPWSKHRLAMSEFLRKHKLGGNKGRISEETKAMRKPRLNIGGNKGTKEIKARRK